MKFWLALLVAWVLACGLSPAGQGAESAGSTKSTGQFGILVPEGEPIDQIRPLLDQRNLGWVGWSVAISADGKWVATGTSGGAILIWDLDSGRQHAKLQGHEGEVSSVAFSPDGRTLGSGAGDKTVRLWDLASGRERAKLQGHEGGDLR